MSRNSLENLDDKHKEVSGRTVKISFKNASLFSLVEECKLKSDDLELNTLINQINKFFLQLKKIIGNFSSYPRKIVSAFANLNLYLNKLEQKIKEKSQQKIEVNQFLMLHKIRLNVAICNYLLEFGLSKCDIPIETLNTFWKELKKFINPLYIETREMALFQELSWYIAYQLYIEILDLKSSSIEDRKKQYEYLYLLCNKINQQEQCQTLFIMLRKCFEALPGYPDIELFKKTLGKNAIFPHVPLDWKVDQHCSLLAHEYTKSLLKNKEYFSADMFIKSTGIIGNITSDVLNKLASPQQPTLAISKSFLHIAAAHFMPIPRPYIKIELPKTGSQLPEFILEKIQAKIIQRGYGKKLCDSSGILYEDTFNEEKKLSELSQISQKVMQEYCEKYGTVSENINDYIQCFKKSKEDYRKLLGIRDQLFPGMSKTKALLLLKHCLQAALAFYPQYSPVQQISTSGHLTKILEAVTFCLEIQERSRVVNENKLKRNEEWFVLSQRIISYACDRQQSVLIPTGNPVKPGEDVSGHALYVLLKYNPISIQEKALRFITDYPHVQFIRPEETIKTEFDFKCLDLVDRPSFLEELSKCQTHAQVKDSVNKIADLILEEKMKNFDKDDVTIANKKTYKISKLRKLYKKSNSKYKIAYQEALHKFCHEKKVFKAYVDFLKEEKSNITLEDIHLYAHQKKYSICIWKKNTINRIALIKGNIGEDIAQLKQILHLLQVDEKKHCLMRVIDKNLCDSIQVVITNGGSGREHHRESKNNVKGDKYFKEYHYAAFRPVELTLQNKQALEEYVWVLLATPYTKTKNDENYKRYSKNFYLFNEEKTGSSMQSTFYFHPRKGSPLGNKITLLKRIPISKTFLAQVAGNCTMHNLKKALQFMYNLDEFLYCALEDSLILGLDKLISLVHEKKPCKEINYLPIDYQETHAKDKNGDESQESQEYELSLDSLESTEELICFEKEDESMRHSQVKDGLISSSAEEIPDFQIAMVEFLSTFNIFLDNHLEQDEQKHQNGRLLADFIFESEIQQAVAASIEQTIKKYKIALEREAKALNYVCQNVEGDGNCFFYAIVHQELLLKNKRAPEIIKGTFPLTLPMSQRAADLRKLVADEIKNHWNLYQKFIPDGKVELEAMAQDRAWVGELAARALVNAWARQGLYRAIVILPHEGAIQTYRVVGATHIIVLGNEVGIHFQSLKAQVPDLKLGQPTEQLTEKNGKIKVTTLLWQYINQLSDEAQEEKVELRQKIKLELIKIYPIDDPGSLDQLIEDKNMADAISIYVRTAAAKLELEILEEIILLLKAAAAEKAFYPPADDSDLVYIFNKIDFLRKFGSKLTVVELLKHYDIIPDGPCRVEDIRFPNIEVSYQLLQFALLISEGLIYEKDNCAIKAKAVFEWVVNSPNLQKLANQFFSKLTTEELRYHHKNDAHLYMIKLNDYLKFYQLKSEAYLLLANLEDDEKKCEALFNRAEYYQLLSLTFSESIKELYKKGYQLPEQFIRYLAYRQPAIKRVDLTAWKNYQEKANCLHGAPIKKKALFAAFQMGKAIERIGGHDDKRNINQHGSQRGKGASASRHGRNQGVQAKRFAKSIPREKIQKYEKELKTFEKLALAESTSVSSHIEYKKNINKQKITPKNKKERKSKPIKEQKAVLPEQTSSWFGPAPWQKDIRSMPHRTTGPVEDRDYKDFSFESYQSSNFKASLSSKTVRLERLDIGYNKLGDAGIAPLWEVCKKYPQGAKGKGWDLHLASNELTEQTADQVIELQQIDSVLFSQIKIDKLTVLDLSNKKLREKDLRLITDALEQNPGAKTLLLARNQLGTPACLQVILLAVQRQRHITTLDLTDNQIDAKGAIALTGGLRDCASLRTLKVGHNPLGAEGAVKIAKLIGEHPRLQILILDNAQLGDAGIQTIASSLVGHPSLTQLSISNNQFTNAGALSLLHVFQQNGSTSKTEQLAEIKKELGQLQTWSLLFTPIPALPSAQLLVQVTTPFKPAFKTTTPAVLLPTPASDMSFSFTSPVSSTTTSLPTPPSTVQSALRPAETKQVIPLDAKFFLQEDKLIPFKRKKVAPDGNCLFHVMAYGIKQLTSEVQAVIRRNLEVKEQSGGELKEIDDKLLRGIAVKLLNEKVQDAKLAQDLVEQGLVPLITLDEKEYEDVLTSMEREDKDGQLRTQLNSIRSAIAEVKDEKAYHTLIAEKAIEWAKFYRDVLGIPGVWGGPVELYALEHYLGIRFDLRQQLNLGPLPERLVKYIKLQQLLKQESDAKTSIYIDRIKAELKAALSPLVPLDAKERVNQVGSLVMKMLETVLTQISKKNDASVSEIDAVKLNAYLETPAAIQLYCTWFRTRKVLNSQLEQAIHDQCLLDKYSPYGLTADILTLIQKKNIAVTEVYCAYNTLRLEEVTLDRRIQVVYTGAHYDIVERLPEISPISLKAAETKTSSAPELSSPTPLSSAGGGHPASSTPPLSSQHTGPTKRQIVTGSDENYRHLVRLGSSKAASAIRDKTTLEEKLRILEVRKYARLGQTALEEELGRLAKRQGLGVDEDDSIDENSDEYKLAAAKSEVLRYAQRKCGWDIDSLQGAAGWYGAEMSKMFALSANQAAQKKEGLLGVQTSSISSRATLAEMAQIRDELLKTSSHSSGTERNPLAMLGLVSGAWGAGSGSHFEFNLLIDDTLMVFDPLGGDKAIKSDEGRAAIQTLCQEQKITNVVVVSNKVQRDAEQKDKPESACGPISVAIAQKFFDLGATKVRNWLQTLTSQAVIKIEKDKPAFQYKSADLTSLFKEEKEDQGLVSLVHLTADKEHKVNPDHYNTYIANLRAEHTRQLTATPSDSPLQAIMELRLNIAAGYIEADQITEAQQQGNTDFAQLQQCFLSGLEQPAQSGSVGMGYGRLLGSTPPKGLSDKEQPFVQQRFEALNKELIDLQQQYAKKETTELAEKLKNLRAEIEKLKFTLSSQSTLSLRG